MEIVELVKYACRICGKMLELTGDKLYGHLRFQHKLTVKQYESSYANMSTGPKLTPESDIEDGSKPTLDVEKAKRKEKHKGKFILNHQRYYEKNPFLDLIFELRV